MTTATRELSRIAVEPSATQETDLTALVTRARSALDDLAALASRDDRHDEVPAMAPRPGADRPAPAEDVDEPVRQAPAVRQSSRARPETRGRDEMATGATKTSPRKRKSAPRGKHCYTEEQTNAYQLVKTNDVAGSYRVIIADDHIGSVRPTGRGHAWQAETALGLTASHHGRGHAARTRQEAVVDLLLHLGIR